MNWRDVPQWCMGANDRFGTCFYAMCGNHRVLLGSGVMSDGEIENAAREIEGFNPYIAATDHGESLEAGFDYIKANGWPGDPTLTIAAWRKIDLANLGDTITRRLAAPTWILLPMTADGSTYDFTDDAVARAAPGIGPHAILPVDATPEGITFITWAQPQGVSLAWARRYFQGSYDVEWTDIA